MVFNSKQLFKWILVMGIFFFLGKMVWENWAQLEGASFAFDPLLLLVSTLVFGFSYFIQIWAWYLATLKLGIAIPCLETLESWFYSQFGKYLPGKVWLLLGRFYFYQARGKPKSAISLALYFETVTAIYAGGIIFLLGLFFLKEEIFPVHPSFRWSILLPAGAAFISLHPRILQKLLNGILRRIKKDPISLSISYGDVLCILFICVISWWVGGIGFYLFVYSIHPVDPNTLMFLAGALAGSSILGLVALFAPSGLGVREGALVYLLSFVIPGSVAVVISILSRIWVTIIEIGLAGMIYIISRTRKRADRESSHV
jgi:hypothetical protein